MIDQSELVFVDVEHELMECLGFYCEVSLAEGYEAEE